MELTKKDIEVLIDVIEDLNNIKFEDVAVTGDAYGDFVSKIKPVREKLIEEFTLLNI